MLTIIGNKLDQTVLEVSGIALNFNDVNAVTAYKSVLSTNYGITVNDVSLITFDDTNIEAIRIRDGAAYSMVWALDELTAVDFSSEDAKNKFTIALSSTNILAGESITITVRLFQSDGVTPKTDINAEFRLPFNGPRGNCYVRLQFAAGVATKTVPINNEGIYVLGLKRVGNFVLDGELPVVEVDL